MTLVDHERRAVCDLAGEQPEALIEEARRRTRDRRLRGGIGVLLLVALAGLAFFASAGESTGILAETATQPFVNVKAFSHHGELAFISRSRLWVLDGNGGTLRKLHIPAGFEPALPTFSSDGRWLAYLATRSSDTLPASELWLAKADGTDGHEVAGLAVDQLVGWSPRGDVLAVIAEAEGWYANDKQGQLPVAVKLVSPRGAVSDLLLLSTSPAQPTQVESVVWSPSGDRLAVSIYDPLPSGGTTIRAYPVAGGRPTRWFSIGNRQHLAGACPGPCGTEATADLAGWWPGWGVAFWAFTGGMSHNNDSTPLEAISAPGARPHLIAKTLSDGVTDAVAPGADGSLAVVDSSANAGRELGQGKVVEHCDATSRLCTPVPGGSIWTGPFRQPCIAGLPCPYPHPASGTPGSGVSLDPVWSPTAPLLAYVKAPFALIGGNPTVAWYTAHQLYVWNAKTDTTHRVAEIDGVSAPSWSRDGRDLLYVNADGLWLSPASGGKPVEIEHPLFPESEWNRKPVPPGPLSYYGQIDWAGQFSWWSP